VLGRLEIKCWKHSQLATSIFRKPLSPSRSHYFEAD
jgi:hypothetical protein